MFLSRLSKFITAATLALVPAGYAHAQTALATSGTGLTNLINNQFPNNTSGQITPSNLRQVTLDMVSSSMLGCLNAQTGTSYTIATSDYGCLITFKNSGTVSVTLPQGVATNATNTNFFPFNVFITNNGAGTVVITPSGSTINSGSSYSLATGQGIWIVSDGANYQVFGGLAGSASGTCSIEASGAQLGCINLTHAYTFTSTITGSIVSWTTATVTGETVTNGSFTTLTFKGQLVSAGGTPSVSSCGTLPSGSVSATSTNQAGSLQTGGGTQTSCLIGFSTPFPSAPKTCVITPQSSSAAADTTQTFVSALTAGGWSLTASSTLNSATFGYICM